MIDTLLANLDRFDAERDAGARLDLPESLRGGDDAPAGERRRPRAGARGSRRCSRGVSELVPLVVPLHPRGRADARGGRAGGRRPAPHRRPARLRRLPVARPRRRAGRDGLRRHPGGDDGPRRPVPDRPAQHRAPDHDHPRHEPPAGARGGRRVRPVACWPTASRSRPRARRSGTATPASGSPRSSRPGSTPGRADLARAGRRAPGYPSGATNPERPWEGP